MTTNLENARKVFNDAVKSMANISPPQQQALIAAASSLEKAALNAGRVGR